MPSEEAMKEYLDSVVARTDGGKGLTSVELRLSKKFKETQDEVLQTRNDISNLENTIRQAEQRLDGLRKDYTVLHSKAAGVAEAILALKFGEEFDKEKAKQEKKDAATRAKGNGSKDPSAPKKKKKTKRDRPSRRATA